MKLAILIQHYFPYGGLQRDALRLASAALSAGHEPTVIVSTWEGDMPEDIPVQVLASGGTQNHSRAAKFANDCQKLSHQYDSSICFSRVPGSPFHFCGDPCLSYRITRDKPALARLLPRYRYLLQNEAAIFGKESPTHTFFLADSELPPYQKHYQIKPNNYTVLPPWLKKPTPPASGRAIMRQKLFDSLSIPPERSVLLFVGSDFHRKGLDLAIRAMGLGKNQSSHLVVCGQDTVEPFKKISQEVSANVHFLGPRDDIPDWMACADLLIHPARQETAGMVLTEALTYGLPVLCTDNCGYAQYVSAAGCPTLSTNPSPQDIAKEIDNTLSKREELSCQIRDWASDPARYNTAQIMLDKIQESLNQSDQTS